MGITSTSLAAGAVVGAAGGIATDRLLAAHAPPERRDSLFEISTALLVPTALFSGISAYCLAPYRTSGAGTAGALTGMASAFVAGMVASRAAG